MKPSKIVACLAVFLATLSVTWGQNYEGNVYYQPPIVPIELSVNSRGELEFRAVPEVVTPLGTFGIGGGVSSRFEDGNTYFILRDTEKEQVFALGDGGKIRLSTVGESDIEISPVDSKGNAFLIDVQHVRGDFRVEFVPDTTSSEVARYKINIGIDVVLDRDGTITLDALVDQKFNVRNLQEVIWYSDSAGSGTVIQGLVFKDESKYKGFGTVYREEPTPAEMWFNFCLSEMFPSHVTVTEENYLQLEKSLFAVCSDGNLIAFGGNRCPGLLPIEDIKSISNSNPLFGNQKLLTVKYHSTGIPMVLGFDREADRDDVRGLLESFMQ